MNSSDLIHCRIKNRSVLVLLTGGAAPPMTSKELQSSGKDAPALLSSAATAPLPFGEAGGDLGLLPTGA